jgi:hypothetical protein
VRRILTIGAATAALFMPANALAARHDAIPLHQGSSGPRVSGLQWMLAGHKPSAYRGIATFPVKPNGFYGARTGQAVYRLKYRLGWPQWSLRGSGTTAGQFFLDVLQGKQKRPLDYLLRSAPRVSAPVPTDAKCDLRVAAEARSLLALNVHEQPDGSNRDGPILHAIQAETGAFGLAWCMSTDQYILDHAGVGTIANRSAGVFYTVGWARARGLVRARPKVGSLAMFLDGQGHTGTVVAVTAHGYVTVEGNASNRMLERFHLIGDRPTVWIYPPHPKGGCR